MKFIKKIDIFVFKAYSLLFVGTFFICLFIFMMQFMWRYVDELIGKGLTLDVLSHFFYYAGLTLIPYTATHYHFQHPALYRFILFSKRNRT